MKQEIFWVVCLTAVLVASCKFAFGQEIAYDYDLSKPVGLKDINNKGSLLISNIASSSLIPALMSRKAKYQPAMISCLGQPLDGTIPRRLLNSEEVIGSCLRSLQPFPVGKEVGFVRDRKGFYNLIDDPGTTAVLILGGSDLGDSVGFYCGPVLPTGGVNCNNPFLVRNGVFETMNLPVGYMPNCRNVKRQTFGVFVDPNDPLQLPKAWMLDAGTLTFLQVPGAQWTEPLDCNNDSQVLLNSDIGDFLLDDGIYFKISSPATLNGLPANFQFEGMNDARFGQLVGTWRTVRCNGEFCSTVSAGGFVATPK